MNFSVNVKNFEMKRGAVVVAQKPSRGAGEKFPTRENFTRIDVTSGSAKKFGSVKATSLSPLFLGPVKDCDGEECDRFENLWQYRKVFPQLGHWDEEKQVPSVAWVKWRRAGYKKLKKGKGIRTPPEVSKLKKAWRTARDANYEREEDRERAMESAKWTPSGLWWSGECLDYIASRKLVYVPTYANLIRESAAFKAMQELVEKGENVMIMDLDGPPISIYPSGLEVTLDNLKTMINDPRYLFGHGYVVAALLADISIEDLCLEEPILKKSKSTK